jgi:hypothetical protein
VRWIGGLVVVATRKGTRLGTVPPPALNIVSDENTQLVDSVMSNLKTLLQEMADTALTLETQWAERSKALRNSGGFQMFEPTREEELQREQEQRACDELYDKARTMRECMGFVARTVNKIIGENIVIQFSKWNI